MSSGRVPGFAGTHGREVLAGNGFGRSSCRAGLSEGLDIRNLPAYARSIKTGNELTVVVTLLSGIADPSRASGMVVTMSDAATKFRTLNAAISQMKAASTGKGAAKPGE